MYLLNKNCVHFNVNFVLSQNVFLHIPFEYLSPELTWKWLKVYCTLNEILTNVLPFYFLFQILYRSRWQFALLEHIHPVANRCQNLDLLPTNEIFYLLGFLSSFSIFWLEAVPTQHALWTKHMGLYLRYTKFVTRLEALRMKTSMQINRTIVTKLKPLPTLTLIKPG